MLRRVGIACLLLLGVGVLRTSFGEPDAPARGLRLQVRQGHSSRISAAWLSKDERFVLSVGPDAVLVWDAASGREVRRFGGYQGTRHGVALSPDGERVLLTQPGGEAVLMDIATGAKVRGFPDAQEHAVAFSHDGARVAFGSLQGGVGLWDVTGRRPTLLSGHSGAVDSIVFSNDGSGLFTGSKDGTVRRWSKKGRGRAVFKGHPGGVVNFELSADGRRLVVLAADDSIRVWDTAKASRPRATFAPHGVRADGEAGVITDIALSSDGTQLALGTEKGAVELWDVVAQARRQQWETHERPIESVEFSGDATSLLYARFREARLVDISSGKVTQTFIAGPLQPFDAKISANGATIAVRDAAGLVNVWDATRGQPVYLNPPGAITSVAVSPDGRTVLTGDGDKVVRLRMGLSGRILAELKGHPAGIGPSRFTPDGQRAVTSDTAGNVYLWDLATGVKIRGFAEDLSEVSSLTISADSRRLATVSVDEKRVDVWDLNSGKRVSAIRLNRRPAMASLSPDGRTVALRGADTRVDLYDADSGELRRSIPDPNHKQGDAHTQVINCLAISPDGKQLLTGGRDHTLRLWSLKTGAFEGILGRHDSGVLTLSYTADGEHVVTASADWTVRIWDVPGRRLAASLCSDGMGRWCVTDPDQRFDASDPAHNDLVHWVNGRRTFPLADFKARYFEPGLLAKVMGWSKELSRPISRGPLPKPPPSVTVALAAPDKPVVTVTAADEGGGVGPIEVHLNGKQVRDDARGGTVARSGAGPVEIDLTGDPRILPGELNRIEVSAWNADSTARRRGRSVEFAAPGTPKRKPTLWAIVCGVSDYAGTDLDLEFAAKDAQAFGSALNLAASELFGTDRTQVTILTSPAAPGTQAATRANLMAAFERVKESTAGDIFVVYLAGHGIVSESGHRGYHYLLAGASSEDLGPDAGQVTLSSDELIRLVRAVPAVRKQLLILDTCAAGQVRDDVQGGGSASGTQGRTLEQIKDATGMFILAGCAANESSYESSQIGQGLLTYALLHGMACGCHFTKNVFVDVQRLVNYAWEMVPILAGQIAGAGAQHPVKTEGDKTFKMGKLSPEARRKIPLVSARPMVIRSSFQRATPPPYDASGVGPKVNAALQGLAEETDGPPSVLFVDTQMMSGTYQVSGTYELQSGGISGTAYVSYIQRDGVPTTVGQFEFKQAFRTPRQQVALAEEVAGRAVDLIQAHRQR